MTNYIDVSDHPLTKSLQLNFESIRSEYDELSSKFLGSKPNNKMGSIINQKESNGKMLYQGIIKSVFTRVAYESCSPTEANAIWGTSQESKKLADEKFLLKQQLTPTLEKMLEPFHPYVGTVGFNLMSPGAKLSMHYGMVSKFIRFHMGLICDPEAKFIVNNCSPRAWEPKKVWAFDDGKAYHGTIHNGVLDRVILIVDIDKECFNTIIEEPFCQ